MNPRILPKSGVQARKEVQVIRRRTSLRRPGKHHIAQHSRAALAFYVALVLCGCHEATLIPEIRQVQVDAVAAYASYGTDTIEDVTPIVKRIREIQAHPQKLLAQQLEATAIMLERHKEDRVRQGVWPKELVKLKAENVSVMFEDAVEIAQTLRRTMRLNYGTERR